MCTNFTMGKLKEEVAARFKVDTIAIELPLHESNFPAQMVAVVTENSPRILQQMQWGLIPSWAKDPAIGKKMINARVETIAEKPSFKTALSRRRCLIPGDGFFEWHTGENKKKTRYYFHLKDHELFAFAGLWEEWISPEGEIVRSCTMITCEPNSLVGEIHNRMPVILLPEDEAEWLNSENTTASDLLPLLLPYPENHLISVPRPQGT